MIGTRLGMFADCDCRATCRATGHNRRVKTWTRTRSFARRVAAGVGLMVAMLMLLGSHPAGANIVTGGTVACDGWSFSWSHFPTTPVILTVAVDLTEAPTVEVLTSTGGDPEGEASGGFARSGSGPATLTVGWTLGDGEHVATFDASLSCEPTTTTTTVPPSTTTTVPPPVATTVPPAGPTTTTSRPSRPIDENCDDGTLPRTGAAVVGVFLLGAAAAVVGAVAVRLTGRSRWGGDDS